MTARERLLMAVSCRSVRSLIHSVSCLPWTPVFVLLNIALLDTVESDIIALAPAQDSLIAALKRAHPTGVIKSANEEH